MGLFLQGCGSKEDSKTAAAPPASQSTVAANNSSSPGDDDIITDADLADEKAADAAEKKPDPRLHGLYRATLDESSISLANRRRPDYEQLAEKARLNAPTIMFFDDGKVRAKLVTGKTAGFVTVIKERVTLVLRNPDKTSKLKKLTLPLRIYDNGDDFTLNIPGNRKPLYKKVPDGTTASTSSATPTPAAPAKTGS